MSYIIYTPDNTPSFVRKAKALTIQFNGNTGLITINKDTVEALNLKPGTKIQFPRNQETNDTYIRIAPEGEAGFELRGKFQNKKQSVALCFNNMILARRILETIADNPKSATLRIATEIEPEADGYFINHLKPIRTK